MSDQRQTAAVVVGVGPQRGLGAALARRFAAEGRVVFIAGRTEARLRLIEEEIRKLGGVAVSLVTDASNSFQVESLFDAVDSSGLALDLVACTVDRNLAAGLLETEVEMFSALWEANCLAAFLVGKAAVARMQRQGFGTLIFTGASASLRARPPFTAFASAKFALRALAQGMAREFGPQGVHVIHVVLDGVIDGDRARRQFPEVVAAKGESGLLKPESIADIYWRLHCQPPDAWTHEMDIRPYKEGF